MDKKLAGYLGIAAKIRKLQTGDRVIESIRNNEAKVVLLAQNCGANGKKKIQDKCAFYHVPIVGVEDRNELSMAVGHNNCPYVAITDAGIAKQVLNLNKEVI